MTHPGRVVGTPPLEVEGEQVAQALEAGCSGDQGHGPGRALAGPCPSSVSDIRGGR